MKDKHRHWKKITRTTQPFSSFIGIIIGKMEALYYGKPGRL